MTQLFHELRLPQRASALGPVTLIGHIVVDHNVDPLDIDAPAKEIGGDLAMNKMASAIDTHFLRNQYKSWLSKVENTYLGPLKRGCWIFTRMGFVWAIAGLRLIWFIYWTSCNWRSDLSLTSGQGVLMVANSPAGPPQKCSHVSVELYEFYCNILISQGGVIRKWLGNFPLVAMEK